MQRLAILPLLIFSAPLVLAESHSLNDKLNEASRLYYQGDIAPATDALKEIVNHLGESDAAGDRKRSFEYLLDSCVGGLDYECVSEYWPRYAKFISELSNTPEALKLPFALNTTYYSAFSVWLSGNKADAEEWLRAYPDTIPEAPWASREYIRRQLIRARLYLMTDQRDAARLCVDRALMSIVSTENSKGSLLEISSWLVDAIEDLLALGETERAIGLSLTNASFGQPIFPTKSIEYYRLLRVSTNVYEAAGMIPQAKDAAERAMTTLRGLHLRPHVALFLQADVSTISTVICIFANDLDCAKKHVAEHPFNSRISEMRKKAQLQSLQEASFLATKALVGAAGGDPLPPEDLPLLSAPVQSRFPIDESLISQANTYLRFAHALALMREDRDKASFELRLLAPEVITLESKRTDEVGFLPKRGLIDQLLICVLLSAYSGVTLNDAYTDAVIKLMDILARDGRSYAADALALVSLGTTDEVRDELRDVLRLRSRRNAAERADLARVLSAKETHDANGTPLPATLDFRRRAVYVDYATSISLLMSQLQAEQTDFSLASSPPALGEIRRRLSPREVVVEGQNLLGNLVGHLCISKEKVVFTRTEGLSSDFLLNVKLLRNSLTSQNAPSPILDSQYPITSARQIYDVLFKPIESCLIADGSITWVGPKPEGLPLSALLTQGSPDELRDHPLATWPWLVKSFSVSEVSTLSTLVATRRNRPSGPGQRLADFLGVGDPQFSGALNSKNEKLAASVLRGVSGASGLSVLPPLPDTRDEIINAGESFGNNRTELFGASATEAELRRLPLERYAYLEFATHGLVREDLAGLKEAALALTPGSTDDPFNDGLLTASEIADLPFGAKFVALSACNSGALDPLKFASEVPSLSAAFQVTGVPAVLGTLWPVESDASRRVVAETFRNLLRTGSGPSDALALSQRHYLSNPPDASHAHPRFWAPFAIFGDGTAESQAIGEKDAPRIGTLRLFTETGGEVSAVTDRGTSTRVLRAIGDIRRGPRHSSLTIGLRADLSDEWRVEDQEIANSTVAIRLSSGAIFGGFRHGGSDSATIGSLQYIDDKGNVLKEWLAEFQGFDVYPQGGIRSGPDSAFIAFIKHARDLTSDHQQPFDHLIIAEATRGRPLSIKADIETSIRFSPQSVQMAITDESLLIALGKRIGDNNGQLAPPHFDSFHQFSSCGNEAHTSLYVFSKKTFKKTWERELNDIQIVQLKQKGHSSVRMIGNKSEKCEGGVRPGIWEIDNHQEIKELFVDSSRHDTQVRASLDRPDGSLILIGKSTRVTDVEPYEDRDPQLVIKNSGRMWVNFSTRRTDDVILITLDQKLRISRRTRLRAGSDMWVAGGFISNKNIWLYGALGNQAAMFEVLNY